MKPILIIGASVSAAMAAIGFTVLAEQFVARDKAEATAPPAIMPERIAPDLTPPTASLSERDRQRLTVAAPAPEETSGPIAEAMSLLPPTDATSELTRSEARTALPEPLPRQSADLLADGTAIPDYGPASAPAPLVPVQGNKAADTPDEVTLSRFRNLPLIGVYR